MLTVVVQAGGTSSRMGQNKALVPFLGQPLISRVVERVRPLADELLVTTNEPEHFTFLSLPLIPDVQPGIGALGGLLTALSAAHGEWLAVVACDMPFVSARLLQVQFELLKFSGADLVVPETAGNYEPFHALYRRETCLAAVEAALAEGKRRMISWFPQVQVRVMTPEEIRAIEPDQLVFENVNTPEELAAAEVAARQMLDQSPVS